jgi:N-acetyl-gamma-glutamyl-phosphate reductase
MVKVAVAGASGYTGVELIRLLAGHPMVEITCLTSRQNAGEEIGAVFPSLLERIPLVCDPLDVDLIGSKADVIFTALPHQSAMEVIPAFLAQGKKVVDLSADYRLRDPAAYEAWYQKHTSPHLLPEAVYGLPEIYREQVRGARLVANPGCFPTSVALGLAPLLRNGLVDLSTIVVDSKSGTSGAGRSAKTGSLFCEVNEGFKAYGVASHRHTPEIEQTLSDLAGTDVVINFTPHLLPVNRGILSTCYATLKGKCSTGELVAIYRDFYRGEAFVRVYPEGSLPNVAFVRGSNFCDVGLVSDPRTGRVIVVSAIDNLVKGAAGQAVQNMNLVLEFEESLGLTALPVFP